MQGPVQTEGSTMTMSDETQEKRVDQEKLISEECTPAFVCSSNKGNAAKKRSAKANLHELCAKEHWKQPVFQCCDEEGPDHQKFFRDLDRFTFKVLVEVQDALTMLECYGNPRANKKAAADNAAEGALWCLKHMGYQLKKQ